MKCPVCQCTHFYVKDPENPFIFYNFSIKNGEVVFDPGVDTAKAPAVDENTIIFCIQCSWSGKFRDSVS
jgi:hypothetical protein